MNFEVGGLTEAVNVFLEVSGILSKWLRVFGGCQGWASRRQFVWLFNFCSDHKSQQKTQSGQLPHFLGPEMQAGWDFLPFMEYLAWHLPWNRVQYLKHKIAGLIQNATMLSMLGRPAAFAISCTQFSSVCKKKCTYKLCTAPFAKKWAKNYDKIAKVSGRNSHNL